MYFYGRCYGNPNSGPFLTEPYPEARNGSRPLILNTNEGTPAGRPDRDGGGREHPHHVEHALLRPGELPDRGGRPRPREQSPAAREY